MGLGFWARRRLPARDADVIMTASALLHHGPEHAAVLLDGLATWMARKGFQTRDQFRGMLAVPADTDQEGYERASYVSAMRARTPVQRDVLSRGGSQPWLACSNVRSRIMWRQWSPLDATSRGGIPTLPPSLRGFVLWLYPPRMVKLESVTDFSQCSGVQAYAK